MDYSKWRGTAKNRTRERLVLDVIGRDLVANAMERVLHARTREDIDLVRNINEVQSPWLDDNQSEEDILNSLDQLLEDGKK